MILIKKITGLEMQTVRVERDNVNNTLIAEQVSSSSLIKLKEKVYGVVSKIFDYIGSLIPFYSITHTYKKNKKNEDLKNKNEALEKEKEELEKHVEVLQKKIEGQEKLIKDSEAEIGGQEEKVKVLQKESRALQRKVGRLEKHIEVLENSIEVLEENIQEIEDIDKGLEGRVKVLEEENRGLQSAVRDLFSGFVREHTEKEAAKSSEEMLRSDFLHTLSRCQGILSKFVV